MDAMGLITAAGKSTRMGGFPKPLLRFREKRFVEQIIHMYSKTGIENQLVVLGHEGEIVHKRANFGPAEVIINKKYESGMLSSVQLGVHQAQNHDVEAMYLWPVDYPCVPAKIIRDLWDIFQETSADIVVPSYNGDRGHPALFGRTIFEPLLTAPKSGGARAIVYDDDTHVVDLEVNDERILIDIDTPSEYWEAVKRYGDEDETDRYTAETSET